MPKTNVEADHENRVKLQALVDQLQDLVYRHTGRCDDLWIENQPPTDEILTELAKFDETRAASHS